MVSSQTKYVALSMVSEYAFLVFRFFMFKHLGNAYQQGEGMMKIEHVLFMIEINVNAHKMHSPFKLILGSFVFWVH